MSLVPWTTNVKSQNQWKSEKCKYIGILKYTKNKSKINTNASNIDVTDSLVKLKNYNFGVERPTLIKKRIH